MMQASDDDSGERRRRREEEEEERFEDVDIGPTYATPTAPKRDRDRRMSVLSQPPLSRFSFITMWTKQSFARLFRMKRGREQELMVREPTFDDDNDRYLPQQQQQRPASNTQQSQTLAAFGGNAEEMEGDEPGLHNGYRTTGSGRSLRRFSSRKG